MVINEWIITRLDDWPSAKERQKWTSTRTSRWIRDWWIYIRDGIRILIWSGESKVEGERVLRGSGGEDQGIRVEGVEGESGCRAV